MKLGKTKEQPKPTPEKRIESANTIVNGAFIMFQQAEEALLKANEQLKEAISETEWEIEDLKFMLAQKEKVVSDAKDQIKNNEAKLEKVSEFTK